VKDVIDTAIPDHAELADLCRLRVGRDAACVAVVRGAGAVILARPTPWSSPPAVASAVAQPVQSCAYAGRIILGFRCRGGDFMVPLAFGTQTGGSLIRPPRSPASMASSQAGTWSARGRAHVLGHAGHRWLVRPSVDDLILVGQAFRLPPCGTPVEVRGLRVGYAAVRFGRISSRRVRGAGAAAKRLAAAAPMVTRLVLPDAFNGLTAARAAIMHREGGVSFLPEYVNAYGLLAQELRDKGRERQSRF